MSRVRSDYYILTCAASSVDGAIVSNLDKYHKRDLRRRRLCLVGSGVKSGLESVSLIDFAQKYDDDHIYIDSYDL